MEIKRSITGQIKSIEFSDDEKEYSKEQMNAVLEILKADIQSKDTAKKEIKIANSNNFANVMITLGNITKEYYLEKVAMEEYYKNTSPEQEDYDPNEDHEFIK